MLLEAIRDAEIEVCLLSGGPAPSRLGRIMCPSICLDFADLGPAIHFTGETSRTCYTLVFVVTCPEKGRAINFATDHTDGYMGFFPPGGVIDVVTPEGYATASLTVPVARFDAALALHFPEVPDKVLECGAGMRVGLIEQFRLKGLLEPLAGELWRSPGTIAGSVIRQQVENELLAVFLAALRSGCADLVPPPTNRVGGRLRRLRQARDFLAANSHEPIYLDDLCSTLGLTRRGVENLFQDLIGVSPMTYLRHQRLHGARRALLRAERAPGVIKSTAIEWGFLHQGHFAADYRALFDESPVETLARE
jgi:AraC-like DNA-binding protein